MKLKFTLVLASTGDHIHVSSDGVQTACGQAVDRRASGHLLDPTPDCLRCRKALTAVNAALQDALIGDGERELSLGAATLWNLDILYEDKVNERFLVKTSGELPTWHQSDSRVLTDLIGFRITPFSDEIDLSLTLALKNPQMVVGLHPVFDTTEGFPSTALGTVTGFTVAA